MIESFRFNSFILNELNVILGKELNKMTKTHQTKRTKFPEMLENRCVPAVITYPLASSIIIFDPVGDREPDPGPLNAPPQYDFILVPPLNVMQLADPGVDTSTVA